MKLSIFCLLLVTVTFFDKPPFQQSKLDSQNLYLQIDSLSFHKNKFLAYLTVENQSDIEMILSFPSSRQNAYQLLNYGIIKPTFILNDTRLNYIVKENICRKINVSEINDKFVFYPSEKRQIIIPFRLKDFGFTSKNIKGQNDLKFEISFNYNYLDFEGSSGNFFKGVLIDTLFIE